MSGYTSPYPAPWKAERGSGEIIIVLALVDGQSRAVAACDGPHAEANSALICAAPLLMDAILTNNIPAGRAALESRGLA